VESGVNLQFDPLTELNRSSLICDRSVEIDVELRNLNIVLAGGHAKLYVFIASKDKKGVRKNSRLQEKEIK
jgi:hypothetical protein